MILFSDEAIVASSTSKSGIRIPLTNNEDSKSSTESTNSTSSIQCTPSLGNCEQVHTSLLGLVFQRTKVTGVEKLSKLKIGNMQSLLVSPKFFEKSSLTRED